MKKEIIMVVLALWASSLLAQEMAADREQIIETIEKAYVQGIQNGKEIENIQKGFHPGFNLLGVDQNNMLTKLPIYTWYSYVEKRVAAGEQPDLETSARFPMVDITGNAAVVKVELYRDGKMIFTDYFSLYRFDEGWKIVSKIYHRM